MPFDQPADDLLAEAIAAAIEQGRVMFLTEDEDVIPGLVRRTKRLAIERVIRLLKMSTRDAESKLFPWSGNDWFIKTSFGGWLFFYPASALNVEDDAGNPTVVFWPDAKGVYHQVTFDVWQHHRRAGHVWRPQFARGSGVDRNGPRTIWDRIRDDDFEG